MAKTILITGGLGFIGINLTRQILKNSDYNLIILTKPNRTTNRISLFEDSLSQKRIKIVTGNILQKNVVNKLISDASTIIHLAAETSVFNALEHTTSLVMTNVVGTSTLLELAVKNEIEKFIIFSSCGVYGDKKKDIPMDENHPLIPVTPYAATKLGAEKIAYSFYRYYKLPVVILRPFNIFGPYQSAKKMIPLFITRLLRNLPIYLNYQGKQTRDWLYIDDLLDAIEMMLNAPRKKVAGEVFNIASGKAINVATIASMILQKLKKDDNLSKISAIANPEPFESSADIKKIGRVVGWSPRFTFSEGLDRTIDWYVKNRRLWDRS